MNARPRRRRATRSPRRAPRAEVNGWINLDKPVGVTSTQAVGRLKRLFNAKKAGHAGTLDPLASGVLAGRVRRGDQDRAGRAGRRRSPTASRCDGATRPTPTTPKAGSSRNPSARPEPAAIAALLPRFIGVIMQTPPHFSAIKIAGERAYDLARDGAQFEIAAREIIVHRLELVDAWRRQSIFEAECGKGAYVRSLARDLGRAARLLRPRVAAAPHPRRAVLADAASRFDATRGRPARRSAAALLGVEAGLSELQRVAVDRNGAATLRRGQRLLLRGAAAPEEGPAYAVCFGSPVAVGVVENGEFVSTRVFNLG